MRGDGVGDRRILFLIQRVIAAHHPLQLGELADHAADEIGLGKDRRAFGQVGVCADRCAISRANNAHRWMRSYCVPSFS